MPDSGSGGFGGVGCGELIGVVVGMRGGSGGGERRTRANARYGGRDRGGWGTWRVSATGERDDRGGGQGGFRWRRIGILFSARGASRRKGVGGGGGGESREGARIEEGIGGGGEERGGVEGGRAGGDGERGGGG